MKQGLQNTLVVLFSLCVIIQLQVKANTLSDWGHVIHRRATSVCGAAPTTFTVTSTSNEAISSPNHPSAYPQPCSYTHTFKTNEADKVIQVRFSAYDMSDVDTSWALGPWFCIYAYLALTDMGFSEGLDQAEPPLPESPAIGVFWQRSCTHLDMTESPDYGVYTFYGNEARLKFVTAVSATPKTGYQGTVKLRDKVLCDFGSAHGDTEMSITEDKVLTVASVPTFKFYGSSRNSIHISENGVITFVNKFAEAQGFDSSGDYDPLDTLFQEPVISPFKADLSKQNAKDGKIFYRITTDASTLQKVEGIINGAFCGATPFVATDVITVTWFRMNYYRSIKEGTRLRNTFQAVIATNNGGETYIIYNFHEITWSTSASDRETGRGGTAHGRVGFTDGGTHTLELSGSGTSSIIDIDDDSNVGMPGRFVFRVDGTDIVQPSSSNPPELTCPPDPAPVLNCGAGVSVSWSDPTVSSCSAITIPISCTPSSPHTFTSSGTVSCSVSNADGQDTCDIAVTVNQDTTPPNIDCPADVSEVADNASGTSVAYPPTHVVDACPVTVNCVPPSNSVFACGDTTVTCTVQDNNGLQSLCSFMVSVTCQSLELSDCPADMMVTDVGNDGEAVTWTPPTASGHVSLTSNYDPGHVFLGGDHMVVYTATDASGDQLTCLFNIHVDSTVYGPVTSNRCKKYLVDTTEETWSDAEAMCQLSGGHLAQIGGQLQSANLINAIQGQGLGANSFWFGASYDGASWIYPGGDKLCYTNWATGEKDDGDKCGLFGSSQWTSESCADTNGFICEI